MSTTNDDKPDLTLTNMLFAFPAAPGLLDKFYTESWPQVWAWFILLGTIIFSLMAGWSEVAFITGLVFFIWIIANAIYLIWKSITEYPIDEDEEVELDGGLFYDNKKVVNKPPELSYLIGLVLLLGIVSFIIYASLPGFTDLIRFEEFKKYVGDTLSNISQSLTMGGQQSKLRAQRYAATAGRRGGNVYGELGR